MKVSELIALLLRQPQDADVFIRDADEGCLLKLDEYCVSYEKGDRSYPFQRVEIGQDYYGDGSEDGSRVRMTRWCLKCAYPDSTLGHDYNAPEHK